MTASIEQRNRLSQRFVTSRKWTGGDRFALWFPLVVFLSTRALNAVMVGMASGRQIAIPSVGLEGRLAIPSPVSPDFWVAAANWDGRW